MADGSNRLPWSLACSRRVGSLPWPSSTRKPGNRRKNDRLDAISLAELYRGGHLTAVRVPDDVQEEIRTLIRLRLAHQREVKRVKHRIQGMLLYQGHHFSGTKSHWIKTHRAWQ